MTPSDLPVEALAKKLESEANYACKDGDRCVCGGDTQRVREGCSAFDTYRATDLWQAASLLRALAAGRDVLRAALKNILDVPYPTCAEAPHPSQQKEMHARCRIIARSALSTEGGSR